MSVEVLQQSPGSDFDLFELWNRVWRRRWLVIAISGMFAVAGVVYSLLATPMFRAETVIVQVRDNGLGGAANLANQLGGLASIVGMNLGAMNGDNNGRALLESRRLTEEFIRRYVPIEQIIEKPGKQRTMWYAVKSFRNGILDINEDVREGKITVTIEWKDPQTAAKFANLYVALANDVVRNRTLTEANRNIEYLNQQIEKTTVVELRRVMYNLIETETKRVMLANSRAEYAFTVIDPAVAPELRHSPKRTRIVLTFTFIGGMLGGLIALLWDARARRRKPAP
jgi:uncharacterized protein involved in exopolysaccharide biosynthesis